MSQGRRSLALHAFVFVSFVLATPKGFPRDCNGNGIDDAGDIAARTSTDCDANGVPDECDLLPGALPASEVSLPTPDKNLAVATGDLDGDGDLDVVAAGGHSQGETTALAVLLNRGDGTFGPLRTVSTGWGGDTFDVALGDIDGDQDLDIAAANPGGFQNGNVSLLFNLGGGFFADALLVSPGGSPTAVVLADLDQNGTMDLIVAKAQTSLPLVVLLNEGGGTFSAEVAYAPAGGPAALAAEDLDGDTFPDIVTAQGFDNLPRDVSVFLNHGDGTLESPVHLDAGDGTIDVALGDVDGDEDVDIFAANERSGDVSLFLNNGAGGFTSGSTIAVAPFLRSLSVTDADGDGDLDLLVVAKLGFAVLISQGGGMFAPPTIFGVIGLFPRAVAVGDLDGDGAVDSVVGNEFSFNIGLLANDGAARFAAFSLLPDSSRAMSLLSADLDGDGNRDLVTGKQIFLNDGSGTLAAVSLGLDTVDVPAAAAADLDGDGDPEVIAVAVGNRVVVLDNQGGGAFRRSHEFTVAQDPTNLAAIDLDNDTYVDLVTANRIGDSVSVLRNNGDGSFAPVVHIATGLEPEALTIADLDDDGALEIITANARSHDISVLRNHGDATFAEERLSVGREPLYLLAADLDGDGDIDLVSANASSNDISVLLNRGNGTLAQAVAYPPGGRPVGLELGDISGDGDVDLVVPTDEPRSLVVLQNQGDGTFALSQTLVGDAALWSPRLADLEGDGDLDLVAADLAGGATSLFSNEGGTFAQPRYFGVPSPRTVLLEDFDGDGNPEIFAAGPFGVFVVRSTWTAHHDCNANAVPDVCEIASGTSTDLDLDGVPDECTSDPSVDVRVVPVPVTIDPSTTTSTRGAQPAGVSSIARGANFWLEVWATDRGGLNTGLTAVYVDIAHCDRTSVTDLAHGDIFTTFTSGTVAADRVDEFGGAALPSGGGLEPQWVRIGWLKMRADVENSGCLLELRRSSGGIAALRRGQIPWSTVTLGSTRLRISSPSIAYDLDGSEQIGVGDLSIFAGSWLQSVPPANVGHDFDCDEFVGVGDLSWFATAWQRAISDPAILYPPCALTGGSGAGARRGGGGGGGGTVDVAFELVARSSPSSSDAAAAPPASVLSVPLDQTYYLELWATDSGDINTGLTSAYVDMGYPSDKTSVRLVMHSTAFGVFPSGTVQDSIVNELGGSNLEGRGKEPEWARVAVVELRAEAETSTAIFSLSPSRSGVAAFGRGIVPWKDIELPRLVIGLGVSQELFRRSDSNADGSVDLSDAVFTLNWLFTGGATPPCPDACDSNDDGMIDLSDAIFSLNWLFTGGTGPKAPGPTSCGPDPTVDALSACAYPAGRC